MTSYRYFWLPAILLPGPFDRLFSSKAFILLLEISCPPKNVTSFVDCPLTNLSQKS